MKQLAWVCIFISEIIKYSVKPQRQGLEILKIWKGISKRSENFTSKYTILGQLYKIGKSFVPHSANALKSIMNPHKTTHYFSCCIFLNFFCKWNENVILFTIKEKYLTSIKGFTKHSIVTQRKQQMEILKQVSRLSHDFTYHRTVVESNPTPDLI